MLYVGSEGKHLRSWLFLSPDCTQAGFGFLVGVLQMLGQSFIVIYGLLSWVCIFSLMWKKQKHLFCYDVCVCRSGTEPGWLSAGTQQTVAEGEDLGQNALL